MQENIYEVFSGNLKRILKERGHTVKDLAEEMDVTQITAYGWLAGKYAPRLSKIQEICEWLYCKPAELFKEKTEHSTYEIPDTMADEELVLVLSYRNADPTRRAVIRELLHIPETVNGKAT